MKINLATYGLLISLLIVLSLPNSLQKVNIRLVRSLEVSGSFMTFPMKGITIQIFLVNRNPLPCQMLRISIVNADDLYSGMSAFWHNFLGNQ